MENNEIMIDLLQLMAGIGVFLMACEIMSKNLEAICSDKLKNLFARVSGSKLIGVMIGALATVAVHSSAATTVMTIGFVNAGIITLKQAATIILGSEIGTTITGQIVALGLSGNGSIDVNMIFSALAGIGVFINMFARKDRTKLFGYVLAGLGMLFAGLNMMSVSMKGFAQTEGLRTFLAKIDSSLLLIIAGAILTAIIQSSSAITSIAITMTLTGLISITQGIYLTLGANVGTCLTGMLAGLKTDSVNARRASLIQLIFNIGGVLLVYVLDILIMSFSKGGLSFGIIFEKMFPGVPHTQLAMFHTIFNITTVLLVLPFTDLLVDLTGRFVKEGEKEKQKEHFYFVDENMITTPAIAVEQIRKEIINMAKIAIDNFNMSIEMIRTLSFDKEEEFLENEKELNFLNHSLVEIIVELSRKANLNKKDHDYLTSTYRCIYDLERIGDYAKNITEYAHNLEESEETFSQHALQEVEELTQLVNELYASTMAVYAGDRKKMKEARKKEDEIDKLTQLMAEKHIRRLNEGKCSPSVGAQYLKLANDTERIGDHLININDQDYALSRS